MNKNTQSPNPSRLSKEPPQYAFAPVQTQAISQIEELTTPVKLLAIVAPVGYGKTVLMAALHDKLENSDSRRYWTTLEERDTQLEDLLNYLEGHSRQLHEQPHPTQVLFRGGETWETRIDRLISIIRAVPDPMTIFIDNLHFCHDPRARVLLDRLLFDTQADARFVFSSTSALPVNLVRAKLEGRVSEIGFAELSLDLIGIAGLLGTAIVEKLSNEHLQTILDQTEGWPAAVRLMQIVMAKSDQPGQLLKQFSGSDQDLVALLNRQVLDGLSPELREFLLAIACLETFDAPLSSYITGSKDAQHHIDYLIDNNLFVMPLDRSRSQFRLHGLMRQRLLSEAKLTVSAEQRDRYLALAAQWCENQGNWRQAIEYAINAGAKDIAVRVLERSALSLVRNQGNIPQYISWARRLLDEGTTIGWETEYWYIWALALNQRYEEGRHQLSRMARRIHRTKTLPGGADSLQDIERRIDIIRMCIDVFTDALSDADTKATLWLETATSYDPFDIAVARCIRSIHCTSIYNFQLAREETRIAHAGALQAQSHYALGWTTALTALPFIFEGHYKRATEPLLASLQTLPAELGENAGICGTIALLAASCLVETGENAKAQPLIEQGFRTAHAHGFIDALSTGMDAALKLCSNHTKDRQRIDQINEIVSHYPPRLAYLVECHWIRRLLRLGDTEEAKSRAAALGMTSAHQERPPWAAKGHGRDIYLSTLADLKLSEPHNIDDTESLIETLFEQAKKEGRTARMVDMRLMQSLLHLRNANMSKAVRRMTQAVNLATTDHIIRPFFDRTAELAPLIEDTRPSTWGFPREAERAFFAAICERVPISDPRLKERLVSGNLASEPREALTKRQMELLLLIEAGLSNQQIADRLDLSLSTVKGHIQGLFGKLDVPSRSSAIAKARILDLI